jgi:hypothetical protein
VVVVVVERLAEVRQPLTNERGLAHHSAGLGSTTGTLREAKQRGRQTGSETATVPMRFGHSQDRCPFSAQLVQYTSARRVPATRGRENKASPHNSGGGRGGEAFITPPFPSAPLP